MKQNVLHRFGQSGLERLQRWESFLSETQQLAAKEKIIYTNQFFNSLVLFQEDKINWNNIDYWATPLETLGKGAADCEDYAIAKYFTLLSLGIDPNQLRLIYVKAQIGDKNSKLFQAHMVLGYYENENSIPYILDNLITSVELATKRTDLKPVFSFNGQGLWVGNKVATTDPTARLSRWRDLIQRSQADGL